MKKIFSVCILMWLLIFSGRVSSQGVVINEILTSNTTVNTDEDGTHQDWVELRNNNSTAVSLLGYGLTDDASLPYKWIFPDVSIAPGAYLLVWCSDKNRMVAGQPLHTNFKISSSGETLTLTNGSGITVDSVPPTALPQNISYGRLPNGTGGFSYFSSVTPNAANAATGYNEILSPPTFSQAAGFFTSNFSLMLSTATPGATILYTLDGSEPSAANLGGMTYSYKNRYPEHPGDAFGTLLNKSFTTLQYSAPIAISDRSALPNKIASISSTFTFTASYIPSSPIFKGTVVRAKLVKPGSLESPTVSKTYIVTPTGSGRFSLPVMSLSISENQLFDYNNGIYVAGVDGDQWRTDHPTDSAQFEEGIGNYYRSGIENEKVANLSYFVNGTEAMNQDVGIRMHGGISRTLPSKSFALYARPDYGNATMDYPFFSGLIYNSFDKLVLRNSGGDFLNTMFRDAMNQEVCRALYPDKEACQNTITLVNGEYWGILNLRDRYGDSYFKRVYNADAVDYLENNAEPKEGDAANYNAMISYINTHPLSNAANYDYIKTQMDPENFADYLIGNIYLLNEDWPNNNVEYWRNKIAVNNLGAPNGLDGRWRWLFHDMDNTFGTVSDNFNLNSLAIATSIDTAPTNPAWSTFLTRKLLENPIFKNYFINRFADLMNTSFLPERVISTIDSMKAEIYGEIPEHIARWKSPPTISDYDFYIQSEKDFAAQRPAFQRNHIRSVFSIASNINATLDVDDATHGYIKMNTIDIKNGTPGITGNPYPWTGIYFSNIPVTIKAIANTGFVFDHWSGASTSTNAEITITQAQSFSVTAHFIAQTVASSEPIYFWMMNGVLANNTPLQTMSSTYQTFAEPGVIQYESCLVGYPFTSSDPLWRKASMERRNSPTTVNYIPEANGNLQFASADMKGLQIKEPLQNNGHENTMVFAIPTDGYKDIKFSFAAINELTNATAISIDYAVNTGTPVWSAAGITTPSMPLTSGYQLYNTDFTTIAQANNNLDFKVRLRFTGTNMTVDAGNRVTFNNIAVHGTALQLAVEQNEMATISVYPNPFTDVINVSGIGAADYKLYSIEGKLIQSGRVENSKVTAERLSKGMYLLELFSNGVREVKKVTKV